MASMYPDSTGESHELSRSRAPIAAGSVSTRSPPTTLDSSADNVIVYPRKVLVRPPV